MPRLLAAPPLLLAAALAAGACRFGGPSGSAKPGPDGSVPTDTRPTDRAPVPPDPDAAAPPPADAPTSDVAAPTSEAGGGLDAPPGDARPPGDGPPPSDRPPSPAEAGAAADVPPAPTDGGACTPPFPAQTCDPVCNTGCQGLTRCDVSEQPRTGMCVGIWIGGEGDICFKGPTTDACAVRLTCLEGRCRRLCYVDSDCTGAQARCCSLSLDVGGMPSGFRVCQPCGT
jgi:hypothetical protein